MAAFSYQALDGNGKLLRGVIESDTQRQARAALRESALTVISVEPVDAVRPGGGSWQWRRGNLSTAQLSLITRQLATLLDAGLPLEQALSALIEQSENEAIRQVMAGVRTEVLGGQTFAKALGRYEAVFPELYRALVTAGEASGELGRVMQRLADYTDSRQVLRQKVVLAFVYPAIVTLVALLVVAGLLVYVVPQVIGVFEQSHQNLPLLTRSLIWVSAFAQQSWGYLLLLSAAFGVSLQQLLRRPRLRYQAHLLLLRLPVLGRLLRGINTARMASTIISTTPPMVRISIGSSIEVRIAV